MFDPNRIISKHALALIAVAMGVLAGISSAQAADIYKTDIEQQAQREVILFHADSPLALTKSFTLQNPPRLVADFANVSGAAGVGLSPAYQGSLIRAIRFGRPSPEVARVVIDLAQIPPHHTASLSPDRLQWKVELPVTGGGGVSQTTTHAPVPLGAPLNAAPPAPIKSIASANYWQPQSVETQASMGQTGMGGQAPTPLPKPLAEVKEAAKPIIVIDAGHGGKDIGAAGVSGIHEKEVTLDYARAVQRALLRSGRYRVVLTRESDVYLFLKERVDIARKHKGNLFVSIHADSNPNPKAQGLSVYTISEQASDAETEALAAQENKSDVLGGIDLSVEDEKVANILIDLAQRETRNKASEFAEALIDSMHPKIPLLTNTHRFAGFRVLKAPDIPSVLVEIGFLSNRDDESRIKSREYQDKVARSMLAALDAHYGQ